jgi:nucleotide-binding universal stress UspA family protein
VSEPRRVVVGVDGSTCSKAALRWAANYAADTRAELFAVTVWNSPMSYGWAFVPEAEGLPERHAAKVLAGSLDAVFGSERPPGLQSAVLQGHPAAALVAAAKGADLLVVGRRGRGGSTAALLGSVSSQCTQHATCPVAVIRN